jgi:hypothetical protein
MPFAFTFFYSPLLGNPKKWFYANRQDVTTKDSYNKVS